MELDHKSTQVSIVEKGTGTEHMLLKLVDRVLKLPDENHEQSAVLAIGVDWESAYDKIDPSITVSRFLEMGLRPSLAPLLIDYFSDRKMTVRFNNESSSVHRLIGGTGQGTLIGQVAYSVANSSAASDVKPEDKYKYCDDLNFLELLLLRGKLSEYNFHDHVPSDIGCDQKFLDPSFLPSHKTLRNISEWTALNKIKLNPSKCN